ncbi:outer membrane protein assembly factor BamB family protein [Allorhodopirellula heiligendammensis]|uniref:Polyvinylalcohol dehydrogenase n=1 Tax=Allorhodopirellula heiligendammensis TaxID=2714739 RepID=A0A5C6BXW8_9BACT|nr:PQQ-binding-like beta-propeller repeat protein [Allorhodopirellula heiligendammensis]TWU16622.1 Polyvinylalcohol dehydrogenase precursor [Allorhodopirellula heiligendammensis]
MKRMHYWSAALLTGLLGASIANAEDWSRFRGPNGSGVVEGSQDAPVRWSPTQNVKWTLTLPGPGVSSPIVVGDRVFVTCYSGYGLDRSNPGDIDDLKRHLLCVDAQSGELIWEKTIDAAQPEDPYTGAGVPSHGYASSSPVSDGEHVFVFFGKTGALAFDFDGNKLWQTSLGMESDSHRWGSASSPILFDDKLIVTAAAESQALVALDKATGKEVWRQEAKGLDNLWGTPALAETSDGTEELVVGVAGEVWGLNPSNGKLRWYCQSGETDQANTSAIVNDGLIVVVGGRGSGSIAVRPGGQGDVSDSHVAWTGRDAGRFATPVAYQGHIYSVASDVLSRTATKSGEQSDRVRLSGGSGRRGGSDYASPIIADGKLYYLKGNGDMFVFDVHDDMKQIAVNQTTNDAESFSGTPALSNGKLYVRSDKTLYCIVDGPFDESAEPAKTEVAGRSSEDAQAGDRRGGPGGGGPGGGGRGDRGGREGGGGRGFDPQTFFNRMDANQDGKLTAAELEGPFQARAQEWDEDKDGSVSLEEFQKGMQSMRGPGGGGPRGGGPGFGGRGGGGGRGGDQRDENRPQRPQRPELDEGIVTDA